MVASGSCDVIWFECGGTIGSETGVFRMLFSVGVELLLRCKSASNCDFTAEVVYKLSKDFFVPFNEKIVYCTGIIGLIECFCMTFVRNLSAKHKKGSMVNEGEEGVQILLLRQ